MPFLLFGLLIAAVVAILVLSHLAAKKRREALAAWAAAEGLAFDPGRQRGFDARFPAFGCLRRGDGRYAYNVMSGTWRNRSLTAFDYHYETHSVDSKGRRQTHHHHFSALIVGSSVPLKPLRIRAEGVFDKLAAAFGFDDIDFESAEFSRRFHVSSPDRKWAYDVLHQRAIEFLLQSPVFAIEFDAAQVVVWRDRTFQPPEFSQAAAVAHGLLDRLPEYLVRAMNDEAR